MHVDNVTMKLSNEEKRIPWFKNGDLSEEEIFSFVCEKTVEQGKQKIFIKEKINKVKIITDYIKIPQENYEIALDMAVTIETEAHQYVISRGWYFGQYLDVFVDKNLADDYPVGREAEDWSNGGEWKVVVKRVVHEL